jgi:hypothetical protein
MSEWSYLMLAEALVFLLSAAGALQLQNSVVPAGGGASANATPVVASATIVISILGAAILGIALIIALNIDSDNASPTSIDFQLCSGLARGVRGLLGVILLYGLGFELLLYTSTDWEAWLSLYSGNQLMSSASPWKFLLFAVIASGLTFDALLCLFLSIHKLLRLISKNATLTNSFDTLPMLQKTPRWTWTVAMTFILLMETQFIMHYSTTHSYSKRPVFISISSLIAASTIFIADVTTVKIYHLRSDHVTWCRILACILYMGTFSGFCILFFIHSELHTDENFAANVCFLAILLFVVIVDIIAFRRLPQAMESDSNQSSQQPQQPQQPQQTQPAQQILQSSPGPTSSIFSTPYHLSRATKQWMSTNLIDSQINTGNRAHSLTHTHDNLRPRTLKLKQKTS